MMPGGAFFYAVTLAENWLKRLPGKWQVCWVMDRIGRSLNHLSGITYSCFEWLNPNKREIIR